MFLKTKQRGKPPHASDQWHDWPATSNQQPAQLSSNLWQNSHNTNVKFTKISLIKRNKKTNKMKKPPFHQIILFWTFQVRLCAFNEEAQHATCSSNASGNDDEENDQNHRVQRCHRCHLIKRQVQIEVTDENPAMFNLEWLDVCSEKVNDTGCF